MKKIYANFKMNTTLSNFKQYANEFLNIVENKNEVALFVPFTHIDFAKQAFVKTNIKIGAQDVSMYEKGAYTGDISAEMLADIGCDSVLIGHSERRNVFGDDCKVVNEKLLQVQKNNIEVVLCIGETLLQKQECKTFEVLTEQIESAFEGVRKDFFDKITLAYEPVYSIGSGIVPSVEEIAQVAKFIKDLCKQKYGFNFDLLYGGSANATNKNTLLEILNIDGLLVGGACLNASTFASITN